MFKINIISIKQFFIIFHKKIIEKIEIFIIFYRDVIKKIKINKLKKKRK